MKKTGAFIFLLFPFVIEAQNRDTLITTAVADSNLAQEPGAVKMNSTDSTLYNKYGDLLHDDPVYNPRYAVWIPAVRVLSADVFNWAVARYFFKYDWAKVSTADWKNNFRKGPEWDVDGFGINFIGHPHTGSFYFNVARSNGYSYWQSLPFAIQGSLTWEYLGENTRPSWNDLINTPVSGMF